MPCLRGGRLHEADRPLQAAQGIVLQSEGQRQVEERLGVRRPRDAVEQGRLDRHQQLAPHRLEAREHAVVDEQPLAVAKRMAVALLHRRAGRRADMGEEQRRLHVGGEVAQIDVAPRRGDASVPGGAGAVCPVPAQPEPVAVGGLHPHPGVEALVDQAVRRLEQELVEHQGLTEVGIPTAHGAIVHRCGPRCNEVRITMVRMVGTLATGRALTRCARLRRAIGCLAAGMRWPTGVHPDSLAPRSARVERSGSSSARLHRLCASGSP